MNIDFNELIQKIQSNSQITEISDPVNLISYGSPNEAIISAEVHSVFAQKELKVISSLAFTESYKSSCRQFMSRSRHSYVSLIKNKK